MTLVILYISTVVIFLGLDYLGLTYLIKPVFERDIGDWLLDEFRVDARIVSKRHAFDLTSKAAADLEGDDALFDLADILPEHELFEALIVSGFDGRSDLGSHGLGVIWQFGRGRDRRGGEAEGEKP